MALGKRIEMVRLELGVSRDWLADRVVGFTIQSVELLEDRDLEHCRCTDEIAEVLGINELWLRSGTGPKWIETEEIEMEGLDLDVESRDWADLAKQLLHG
ncbi:hypothetical protein DET50_12435 [Marinobacter pelagius]|uniref:HTH cro/C1-type domain-containing protein n=1 Tax=Marinobacter pelagius TaxID=379482 RepID=A0A366GDM7_9GAMM|nr:hypothetical protein [Marinobacter pelagius]RBP25042.1 hypothetical protein DET50_12435 [Marinobacter pelagius]